MTRIFISYRRDDAPDMAERIYERLERAFGKGNVFIDVDDIPSGVRFAEYLSQTLAINGHQVGAIPLTSEATSTSAISLQYGGGGLQTSARFKNFKITPSSALFAIP